MRFITCAGPAELWRKCHLYKGWSWRKSGDPWCVTSSIGIFGGEVGGLGRERGACGWGNTKRVKVVFTIAQI